MDEQLLRRSILERATEKLGVGRTNRVPEMEQISEGRANNRDQWGKSYQWCGDFVTWLMEMHGARDNSIVNRSSLGTWTPGQNISKLQAAADRFSLNRGKDPRQGWDWQPADILVFNRPRGSHVGLLYEAPLGGSPYYQSIDGNSMYGAVALNRREEILVQVINIASLIAVAGGLALPQPQPTTPWPQPQPQNSWPFPFPYPVPPVAIPTQQPPPQNLDWFLMASQAAGGAVQAWLLMTQPQQMAKPMASYDLIGTDGPDYSYLPRDGA